jgi:hypothetical protein
MCRVYYSHSNNAQWVYFMAGVESLLTESGKVNGLLFITKGSVLLSTKRWQA